MDNLLQAALTYAEAGWRVFPCKPKEKHPLVREWQHRASTDESQINRWWESYPDANVAIATGEASGIFILDIDPRHGGDTSLDVLESKHGKLPDTPRVITGTGGTHYFFQYVDGIRNSAGQVGAGCDIRGEGGYVIAAPSIHPKTHKPYTWEASSTPDTAPLADAPDWLIELATKRSRGNGKDGRLIIAAKKQISAGARNDYLTREGGKMRKCGMSREAIHAALQGVNHQRCEPPLPEEEVATVAASIANYVPTDDELEQVIERMNEHMALIIVGGHERVLREFPDGEYSVDTLSAVKVAMANRKCLIGERLRNLFSVWLHHEKRRTYARGLMFAPDGAPTECYNTWRGFAVEAVPGDCQLYLDHIFENIANSDDHVNEYVLAWMADAVQNPASRPGTALVLRGEQGVGKGVFALQFGRLFGPHFKHLVHAGSLTGRFNAHLEDALIVYSDEAFWAGDKQAEGTIKALITEDRLLFERKGVDAVMQPNYTRLIMSSNHDWVAPAGMHERRFCILDIGNAKRQDARYFEKIIAQMNDGGRAALLDHLLDTDISAINLRAIPKTLAYTDSQELSLDPTDAYWLDRLHDGAQVTTRDGWLKQLQKDELYESYTDEMRRRNVRARIMTRDAFLKKTCQLTGASSRRVGPRGSRAWVTEFPDLEIAREHFFVKTGIRVEDR